jgi:hypothetical protein
MAERLDDGLIEITKAEVNMPILVEEANFIQCPVFKHDSFARLYISKHGDINKTWMSITMDTMITIEPPFYVKAKYPCKIPVMKV